MHFSDFLVVSLFTNAPMPPGYSLWQAELLAGFNVPSFAGNLEHRSFEEKLILTLQFNNIYKTTCLWFWVYIYYWTASILQLDLLMEGIPYFMIFYFDFFLTKNTSQKPDRTPPRGVDGRWMGLGNSGQKHEWWKIPAPHVFVLWTIQQKHKNDSLKETHMILDPSFVRNLDSPDISQFLHQIYSIIGPSLRPWAKNIWKNRCIK